VHPGRGSDLETMDPKGRVQLSVSRGEDLIVFGRVQELKNGA